MTLKGVMALILRYFTQFGSFGAHSVKVVEDVVVKKFTFAISSPDEFLVLLGLYHINLLFFLFTACAYRTKIVVILCSPFSVQ